MTAKRDKDLGSASCMSFRTLLHPSEEGTKEQLRRRKTKRDLTHTSVYQSVQEMVENGWTFLARTQSACVELVHARVARIAQRWKDTFGARSDVSLAHDCDRRSRCTGVRAWKNEMGKEQFEAGNIAGERICWRKSPSAVDWPE